METYRPPLKADSISTQPKKNTKLTVRRHGDPTYVKIIWDAIKSCNEQGKVCFYNCS